jgi:hypothetical protein
VCSAAPVSASEWTTVDMIQSAFARDLTADSAGNLYVLGNATVNNVQVALLSKSSDGGNTWSDSSVPGVSTLTSVAARTVTDADSTSVENHLVVLGPSSENAEKQLILRSLDGGGTWETVDVIEKGIDVALDVHGNIYVAGVVTKTITVVSGKKSTIQSYNVWMVRRIGRYGGKDTREIADTRSNPSDIICVGTKVYLAGDSNGYWRVMMSEDGGSSWQVLDNYRYQPPYFSLAYALAADSQGNLWVVGQGWRTPIGKGNNAFNPAYWLTRKGVRQANGTYSFDTVDTFELDPFNWTRAAAIAVDSEDNIYVTGSALRSTATPTGRWITRTLAAGGNTWRLSDELGGAGRGVAADPFGNVFTVGTIPGTDGSAWVVRRQLAPVAP